MVIDIENMDFWNFLPRARAFEVLCWMIFWGQLQNYMMRMNLSLLILAMTKSGTMNDVQSGNSTGACGFSGNEQHSDIYTSGNFEWDEWTKGNQKCTSKLPHSSYRIPYVTC